MPSRKRGGAGGFNSARGYYRRQNEYRLYRKTVLPALMPVQCPIYLRTAGRKIGLRNTILLYNVLIPFKCDNANKICVLCLTTARVRVPGGLPARAANTAAGLYNNTA